MKGKNFIHLLLVLAMLVSQMATNAHMVDHMAFTAIDRNLPAPHSHDHHHGDLILEASSSDDSKTDCSIYHAYAGVNGIAPASCNYDGIYTNSVLPKQLLSAQIVAQTLNAHPIRGPPHHS